MYIHLGEDTVVKQENIVGIFDLDNTSISKHTRFFLRKAEETGKVVNVSYELPRSFVVCCENGTTKVLHFPNQSSNLAAEGKARIKIRIALGIGRARRERSFQ